MSATTPFSTSNSGSALPRQQPPPPPRQPPRGSRRPGFIAAGIAVTVLAMLIAAAAVRATQGTQEAILVVRPIAQGQVIQRADLAPVPVKPETGLAAMSVRHLDEVIGQHAVTGLSKGTLLTPDSVSDANVPPKGKTLVGLELKPASMPSTGLDAGDTIRIIAVPGTSTTAGDVTARSDATNPDDYDDTLPVVNATVASITAPDPGSGERTSVVNVLVAPQDAIGLAARAATGRVAVVVDSRDR